MKKLTNYDNIRWKLHDTVAVAAEKDGLFPAKGVLPRAERILENSTTYLLRDRGHMNNLTEEEKHMITEFLHRN